MGKLNHLNNLRKVGILMHELPYNKNLQFVQGNV